jgi:hypothetical protein
LDATYELFNNKSIQAAAGDEERHRERKPRGKKKKKKRWRIIRSHSPPSSPSSVHETNRQNFFFAVCFCGLFSPSLQEEIDVIMIKNVGAFDDHDGNVLLPVCFSHH